MNTKQRAYLRSLAQKITPIFQIGKNGVTDSLIDDLNNALEARELIKITILNTVPDDKNAIAREIEEKTSSQIVQIVGNKLTLYKQNKEKPKIELP
ncbi:MAG: ribosome assembly RNA-binding protein YhbY [Clostridia bacterium]|nr:ribosome assembly RNA-binding protein YhbY [Clostridia bacterium]